MRAAILLATAMVTASAGAAVAEPATSPPSLTWKATRGTVARGRLPGSFMLASDAVPGRYSTGELISVEEVPLPYRFTITWRRTGVEAGRSMHVLVVGGIVLIKHGAINFYPYDDAAFSSTEWQPLPGHRAHAEQQVVVVQDARAVTVSIDGREVARYPLAVTRPAAHVGVGMKAAPGHRSKLYLKTLVVEPLQ
jgi:hypothetical protein